jgi:hypothetical protein
MAPAMSTMTKSLLLFTLLGILTGMASARDDGTVIKKDVCIGGFQHYRHGSDSWMWIWQDVLGGMITADCAFDKNSAAGKAVMHGCGRILDVVGKELRHACRIEGLFKVYGGKVRMELLRTYNVKLVPTITCSGTLKEHNQEYAKIDRTCLVARASIRRRAAEWGEGDPCSIGKRCVLVGTFTKVKKDFVDDYLIDQLIEIHEEGEN